MTHHTAGLLWMSDQPAAVIATWQHTTLRQTSTRLQQDLNPRLERVSERLQTDTLDRATTGIPLQFIHYINYLIPWKYSCGNWCILIEVKFAKYFNHSVIWRNHLKYAVCKRLLHHKFCQSSYYWHKPLAAVSTDYNKQKTQYNQDNPNVPLIVNMLCI